jgi:hypothetical protein
MRVPVAAKPAARLANKERQIAAAALQSGTGEIPITCRCPQRDGHDGR